VPPLPVAVLPPLLLVLLPVLLVLPLPFPAIVRRAPALPFPAPAWAALLARARMPLSVRLSAPLQMAVAALAATPALAVARGFPLPAPGVPIPMPVHPVLMPGPPLRTHILCVPMPLSVPAVTKGALIRGPTPVAAPGVAAVVGRAAMLAPSPARVAAGVGARRSPAAVGRVLRRVRLVVIQQQAVPAAAAAGPTCRACAQGWQAFLTRRSLVVWLRTALSVRGAGAPRAGE